MRRRGRGGGEREMEVWNEVLRKRVNRCVNGCLWLY